MCGRAVYAQGAADTAGGDGVQHERQVADVVEVRVREEEIFDAQHFFAREVAHAGACVDQYVVIDQERGGLAALRNGA